MQGTSDLLSMSNMKRNLRILGKTDTFSSIGNFVAVGF